MRKVGIVLVGLAVAIFSMPMAPAVEQDLRAMAQKHSRFDLSNMVMKEYTFEHTPGEPLNVVFDHATGEFYQGTASDGPGGLAGCIWIAPSSIWSTDPIGTACTYQFHGTSIESTTLACNAAGGCLVDGINFNFANFGVFVLFCVPSGAMNVQWSSLTATGTATCAGFLFGSNPTTWNAWDSICYVATGVGACVHQV